MSYSSNAFIAKGQSLNYTFRATAGTKPTWTPRFGYFTDEPRYDPRFQIGGQFGGWFYGVRAYGGHGWEVGAAEAKRGPEVNRYSDFAGVLGTGVYVTGVAGTSVTGTGVYGQAGDEDPSWLLGGNQKAGVLGLSGAESTYGIIGAAPIVGIWGISWSGTALLASSTFGIGIQAFTQGVYEIGVSAYSHLGPGLLGYSGPPGPLGLPGFNPYPGVYGTSSQDIGVVGTSTPLFGVYGYSTNNVGVVGHTENPASFGGYFVGNVLVTGNLTVNGTKSAAVPFPDGTRRALYCMESPELWLEDFGTARLKKGRAVVKLDPKFASVISRGGYHVFLTPEGDCRGLYVRSKRAGNFEVREFAGGNSNVAFSYRIVGRRKDVGRRARFPKVNTRLAFPRGPTRTPRKGEPPGAKLRAVLDRAEKQVRELREKAPPSRGVPKQPPPPRYAQGRRR